MIVSALIASTKALKDAMLLSLLGFSMFSLAGIQFFRGTLQNKCVLQPPWMLERLSECTRNIITHEELGTSSGVLFDRSDELLIEERNNCSLRAIYGNEIQDYFGQYSFEQMQYLSDVWTGQILR